MSKTIDDINCEGGPAFPSPHPMASLADPFGMTLRDWFAGQALSAVLESRETRDFDDAARLSYVLADAMLAERAKGGAS